MQLLTLSEAVQDALVQKARDRAPLEACGILAGLGGHFFSLRELENVSPTPAVSFWLAPQDFREACAAMEGLELATWHSHPCTRAFPSRDDWTLMVQTQLPMVIVSLPCELHPYLKIAVFANDERRRPIEVVKYRPFERVTA